MINTNNKRRVIIESPFAGSDHYTQAETIEYAKRAMNHSLNLDEAPIAFHLLYPAVLDDTSPIDRRLAMAAQFNWQSHAEIIAIYTDYGVSKGMRDAIDHYHNTSAKLANAPKIEWRMIGRNPEMKHDGD